MKRKILNLLYWLLIVQLCTCSNSHSQTPKQERQVRAVWIATFFQLDFPKNNTTNKVALTEQWRQLLRQLKSAGINTLYFQVRPSGDAFYQSNLVPWSRFLAGKEGIGPEEDFDLLPTFIAMAHNQGMEFHAWMNPLRATPNQDANSLDQSNVLLKHPEWGFPYGNRYYFNPGLPEVRWHLLEVVDEVLSKYDIDGIHMDDYFYPYPSSGEVIQDSAAFKLYGESFFNIEDWRRSNVNNMIQELSSIIKQKKKYVKFGISPFGVWRNYEVDHKGSNTENRLSSYDDLYADVLKWLDEGWIDYVVPQLYWEIGHPVSDYQTLIEWWSSKVDRQQLIIGHAAHKVGTDVSLAWSFPEEIPQQIKVAQSYNKVRGHAFFRARSLLSNSLGVLDSLRGLFNHPVLLPEFPSQENRATCQVEMNRPRKVKEGTRICWKVDPKKESFRYFGLYRFDGPKSAWKKGKEKLLYTTPFGKNDPRFCYLDTSSQNEQTYTYWVVAFDRFHRRIGSSETKTIEVEGRR